MLKIWILSEKEVIKDGLSSEIAPKTRSTSPCSSSILPCSSSSTGDIPAASRNFTPTILDVVGEMLEFLDDVTSWN